MATPRAEDYIGYGKNITFGIKTCAVRHTKQSVTMSALGQKQTSGWVEGMSALPPIADIGGVSSDVRYVPKADIRGNVARHSSAIADAGFTKKANPPISAIGLACIPI